MADHKTLRTQYPAGHGFIRLFGTGDFPVEPYQHHVVRDTWSWTHNLDLLGKGGDVGGPFLTQKTWVTENSDVHEVLGFGRAYYGTLHLLPTGQALDRDRYQPHSSFDELFAAGSTAIARTIPTNPMSSAAVAVGELRRDGLPAIIGSGLLKSRARDLRKVGDEYLNVEFGWRPMMSDLRSLASSIKKQNSILRQLHHDSGKTVRRRLTLTNESTSNYPSDPESSYSASYSPPSFCNGGPIDAWMSAEIPGQPNGVIWYQGSSLKRWFSGAYTYHMPDPKNGFLSKIDSWEAQSNVLLGTRLTPEVVWNLAPWTWMADWFSNCGDVIHNISQFTQDDLALVYGYLMEERTTFQAGQMRWAINTPSGVRTVYPRLEGGGTTKYRIQASPFGFGLDIGGLNARQMAITGALGLSRAPRVAL